MQSLLAKITFLKQKTCLESKRNPKQTILCLVIELSSNSARRSEARFELIQRSSTNIIIKTMVATQGGLPAQVVEKVNDKQYINCELHLVNLYSKSWVQKKSNDSILYYPVKV